MLSTDAPKELLKQITALLDSPCARLNWCSLERWDPPRRKYILTRGIFPIGFGSCESVCQGRLQRPLPNNKLVVLQLSRNVGMLNLAGHACFE
jgi:hypothetical protein